MLQEIVKNFGDRKLFVEFSALKDEELFRSVLEAYLKNGGKNSVAVETGTFHGLSALFLSQFFDNVITFDITPQGGGYYKDEKLKYDIWNYFGVADKIDFILINDDEEKERIVGDLDFDFAFIDGRHVGGVAKDFEILKKCGNCLFHDYVPNKAGLESHIVEFVDGIKEGKIVLRKPPFALWKR